MFPQSAYADFNVWTVNDKKNTDELLEPNPPGKSLMASISLMSGSPVDV